MGSARFLGAFKIAGDLWSPESRPLAVKSGCATTPSSDQIAGGGGPFGKLKLETGGEQSPGHYAAALEHKFRLGAHQPRTDFDQPTRGGESDSRAPGSAEGSQEFGIGKRVGRRDVNDSQELL